MKTNPKTILLLGLLPLSLNTNEVLVEAEAFVQRRGWKLDTQFFAKMESPHLLARGLGSPVKDTATEVTFSGQGNLSRLHAKQGLGGPPEGSGTTGPLSTAHQRQGIG